MLLLVLLRNRGFFQHGRWRSRGGLFRLVSIDTHDGRPYWRLRHRAGRQRDGGPLPSVGVARCAVSVGLGGGGGRVVADLLRPALAVRPVVGRCAASVEAGFCGERHPGLWGVSTCGCDGGGVPFWLPGRVCGPSCLRAPRGETSAGEGAAKECGTRTRRVRRWASANKQTAEYASPTCFTPARGLRRVGVQQACAEGAGSRHAGRGRRV